jgi:ABC-type antimicrobial peptide transport system permease subunit
MYCFKIILRGLRHNFSYSVINIAGLAIGITASVFIFLWVYNERSYDRHHPDADRIYRIINTADFGTGNPLLNESSPYLLSLAVKEIPEIESTAVVYKGGMYGMGIDGITVNNEIFPVRGNIAYVDRAWLEMFDYKLLEGSFVAFGDHPNSVTLSESEAKKYFGNTSAVGQTVGISGVDYLVQAVVRNNPSNSNFQWNIMVSKEPYLASIRTVTEKWFDFQWGIFVKLRKGANIPEICRKIDDIYAAKGHSFKISASLRPLTALHFETDIPDSAFVPGNSKAVNLFSILGILLLLTACINYVNLSTAKANTRAREVGVRKIVGARRSALFLQFVSESFVVCTIAVLASLTLIWVLSPLYRLLVENAVLSFSSPVIWVILAAILISTTLLNGIYPALVLSSFQPVNFLKGLGFLKLKDRNMRRGLVVFQFVLSTVLIICVMVIYKQMQYIRQMNPGYNREQAVTVKSPVRILNASGDEKNRLAMDAQIMKRALQSQACIAGVTLHSAEITNVVHSIDFLDWDGRPEDFHPVIAIMGADADFRQTLGLELVDGRWFEEDGNEDEKNFILNETAIRELNIHEPHIGQRLGEGRIIGVVKDFHYRSLHEKIGPLVFENNWYENITFKTHAGQSAEAIQAAKKIWKNFFPNDPFEFVFLDDAFNNLYKADIKTSRLMLLFSILAIVIALLGLFGLSTFAVERRTREIGIRKVFGAGIGNIVSLLSKEFLILTGIAIVIAFPLAYYCAGRLLEDFAYRIDIGWQVFAFAGIITLFLILLTIGQQAISAATANPANVIKCE